jgi:hypothetical protein
LYGALFILVNPPQGLVQFVSVESIFFSEALSPLKITGAELLMMGGD